MDRHGKDIKIYIIYESSDQIRVEKIYRKLRDKGFIPWMASQDLLPGEDWRLVRKKNLKESQFVVICLSEKSNKHESDFFRSEIKTALELFERMKEDDIYIIPVKLEECDIPENIERFECFDISCVDDPNSGIKDTQLSKLFDAAIDKGIHNRGLKPNTNSHNTGEYYPNINNNVMIVKLKQLKGREIEIPPFHIESKVIVKGDLKVDSGIGSIEFDYHQVAKLLNKCQDKTGANSILNEEFIKNNIGEYLNNIFFGKVSHRFSDSFQLFKEEFKRNSNECFFIVFEIDCDYIVDFPTEFLTYKNNNDTTNLLVFFEDNRFITFKKVMRETSRSPLKFYHFSGSDKTEFHIILSNTFNINKSCLVDIESTEFFKIQAINLKNNIQSIINKFKLNIDVKVLPDEYELDKKISRDDLLDYFNRLDKKNNHILHFIGQGINDDNGSKVLLNIPSYMVTEQALTKISSRIPEISTSLVQKLKNIENDKYKGEKIFSGVIKGIIGPELFSKYKTEILGYTLIKSESEMEYVNLCEFADELKEKNIRFLYLNCCYGAAHIQTKSREETCGLMRSLVYKTEIPAILGFRWPVNNSTANEFAEIFYSDFFTNCKYIPVALQNTRFYIRRQSSNSESEKIKMCASPILIFQEPFV